MGFEVFEGVKDQLQVLLQGDPECFVDMKVPRLAEDGDHICLGLDKGPDLVFHQKRAVFGLRAITQGGIVQFCLKAFYFFFFESLR